MSLETRCPSRRGLARADLFCTELVNASADSPADLATDSADHIGASLPLGDSRSLAFSQSRLSA